MGNITALSRDFLVGHSFWGWPCLEVKNKHVSHGHKIDLQIHLLLMS